MRRLIYLLYFNRIVSRYKKKEEERTQKQTTDDFKTDSPTLLPSVYGTPNPLCKDSVQGTTDERPYTPFSVGRTLIQMSEELNRNADQEPHVTSVKKLGVPVILPRNGTKAIDQRYVEYNRNPSLNTKKELAENLQHGEQKVRLGILPSRPVDWQREKSTEYRPTTNSFGVAPTQEFPLYRKPYNERTNEETNKGFYMQIRKSTASPAPYYIPEVDYEPSHRRQQDCSSGRNDVVNEQFFRSEVQNNQRVSNAQVIEHQFVTFNNQNSLYENNASPTDQGGNLYSQHVNREVFFRPIGKNESSMEECLSRQKFEPRDSKSEHLSRMTVARESNRFVNYSVDSSNFKNTEQTAGRNNTPFRVSEGSNPRSHWGPSEPVELSKEKLRRVQKFGISVFPE